MTSITLLSFKAETPGIVPGVSAFANGRMVSRYPTKATPSIRIT
jgi:hypothetical protein